MKALLRAGVSVLLPAATLASAGIAAENLASQPIPVPARVSTRLGAAGTTVLCPGPETLAVPRGGRPVAAGGPVVISGVAQAPATLGGLAPAAAGALPAPADPQSLTALGPLLAVRSVRDGAGAVRLDVVRGVDGAGGPAGALQVSLGSSGDLRGLAAVNCPTASGQSWLVGGGTGEGERTRLLLANPTPGPAQVDVVIHGPQGRVRAPGGEGVVVPSGEQVALFVDALAPGVPALAVQVVARTGRVAATLHHSRLRGFVAGGVDDVTGVSEPARRAVVPGVVVAPSGAAAVRVAVPGGVRAVVRVSLIGSAGAVSLPSGVLEVPAGAVRDVAVTGVVPGTYTALVQADEPVLAAAVSSVSRPGGELAGTAAALGRTVPPTELAWAGATSPLSGTVLAALPRLSRVTGVGLRPATLVLAVDGAQPARVGVRQVAASGTPSWQQVDVPAQASVSLPLAADTLAVALEALGPAEPAGRVHAALVLSAEDASGPMVSVVPLRAAPLASRAELSAIEDTALGIG